MFPVEDSKLLTSFLRGQGTDDTGATFRAATNVLSWGGNVKFPPKGASPADFTLPTWLLPLILKILQNLVSGYRAETVKDDDAAGKMEEFTRHMAQSNMTAAAAVPSPATCG